MPYLVSEKLQGETLKQAFPGGEGRDDAREVTEGSQQQLRNETLGAGKGAENKWKIKVSWIRKASEDESIYFPDKGEGRISDWFPCKEAGSAELNMEGRELFFQYILD